MLTATAPAATTSFVYRANPRARGSFRLACWRDSPGFESVVLDDGDVVEPLGDVEVALEREVDEEGMRCFREVQYRRVRLASGFEGTVCWYEWDAELGGFVPA